MKLETKIIELIAYDRIDKPISSMSGKLKRKKPILAQAIELKKGYDGERVFAYIDKGDASKARGMKEGIDKFAETFPKHGKILKGYIEEKRTFREKYLVFGMQKGCKITTQDYVGVMANLGFGNNMSKRLYPELMDISRNLARKRNEYERSILIEQTI